MPTNTQITNFDRPTAISLSSEIEQALRVIAESHGLELEYRGGTYDGGTYKPRVSFKTASSGEREFAAFATLYGLQASDYGREFVSQGRTFKISGVSPRATRRPILATDSTGRVWKFTEASVRAALQSTPAAAVAGLLHDLLPAATNDAQAKTYGLFNEAGECVKTSKSKASLQSHKSRLGLTTMTVREV